jgi:hypothetical protein
MQLVQRSAAAERQRRRQRALRVESNSYPDDIILRRQRCQFSSSPCPAGVLGRTSGRWEIPTRNREAMNRYRNRAGSGGKSKNREYCPVMIPNRTSLSKGALRGRATLF